MSTAAAAFVCVHMCPGYAFMTGGRMMARNASPDAPPPDMKQLEQVRHDHEHGHAHEHTHLLRAKLPANTQTLTLQLLMAKPVSLLMG